MPVRAWNTADWQSGYGSFGNVNTWGALDTTDCVVISLADPSANRTWKVAAPSGTHVGSWALICQGVTANMGAARPFIRSATPFRVSGSGRCPATVKVSAVKSVPKTVSKSPMAING